MKIRTCPNCGYRYPLKVYYRKFIFKFVDSRWNCEKCNSVLTFSFGRRMLVILIALLPILLYTVLNPDRGEYLHLPAWLKYTLFIVVTLIWAFIISGFDTFSVVKKK